MIVLLSAHVVLLQSCKESKSPPSKDIISEIGLKRGELISCGPPSKEFGQVNFEMSCNQSVRNEFNLAMELLHSFEYDESEKAFAKIIDGSPECAMAYWGVAMANFHPLWTAPSIPELEKGSKTIEIAKSIQSKTKRESEYIDAIGEFYADWKVKDHLSRCIRFEKAMEKLHADYPDDKEAAIFYALSLDASAKPTDKSYVNQKKAGSILESLYPGEPNHPGIVHYIIHTYDYPGLAVLALPAARKYATVAPSSAHALHMPSHIFTRLGLWKECIRSNLASINAAICYGESAGIKGHWDEELHGLDYLVYAYLQEAEIDSARKQLDYLNTIKQVYPVNFKVTYAFAAIPSRIYLESKEWQHAAGVQVAPADFPWKNFPWQEAIFHFTKAMGSIHLGEINKARTEVGTLNQLHDTLVQQKDAYKAGQVDIQIKTCEAWIELKTGNKAEAIKKMKIAADMEDATEKHPVTPGAVLPARELLGDMFMELRQFENALIAYEATLEKCPNRYNSLLGAALAAQEAGDSEKATFFYKQLVSIVPKAKGL